MEEIISKDYSEFFSYNLTENFISISTNERTFRNNKFSINSCVVNRLELFSDS